MGVIRKAASMMKPGGGSSHARPEPPGKAERAQAKAARAREKAAQAEAVRAEAEAKVANEQPATDHGSASRRPPSEDGRRMLAEWIITLPPEGRERTAFHESGVRDTARP